MQRDMDLVRLILLRLEANESLDVVTGYSGVQVGHHVYLMAQAGLVDAADVTSLGDEYRMAMPLGITWQGHDFLEAARNENIWARAKKLIAERGGSTAFDVVKAVLIKLATDASLGSQTP